MALGKMPEKPVGVKWLLDSGADKHVLPAHVYDRAGQAVAPLRNAEVQLRAANGSAMDVLGTTTVRLETMGGRKVRVEAVVASDAAQCILSAPRLRRAGYCIQLQESASTLAPQGAVTKL